MAEANARLERDRAALEAVADKGGGAKLGTYLKLSGPGWLQSAITLGGGSLAGGLYLGVLSGYGMMWLQPLAMFLGVAMLCAIAYVTLSTGRRPFRLVVDEVNPVLGWGWAIATLLANVVWCLPQFALGMAALRQNLLPSVLGDSAEGSLGGETGVWVAITGLAVCALLTIISYERGGRGLAIFEGILKVLVGLIVLSFVGVVIKLTGSEGGIDWGRVFSGFIPDLNALSKPPAAFDEALAATSETGRSFWSGLILGNQRDVMLTAAATAVGINMTFLLPNSLLDRGWDRGFRGLSIFDLATGLFVPFLIATACVVIASAARFHGEYDAAMLEGEPSGQYASLLDQRLAAEYPGEASGWSAEELASKRAELTDGDRQLAAMLVKRDAFDLANALAPLTGKGFAQYIFGGGVLAMALSTIVVLMLINGYVFSEVFGAPRRGLVHFVGTLIPLAVGVLAPILWQGESKVALAIPTSVIGFILLPIAYVTFLMLMNNRRLLGDAMPTGMTRLLVNALLGLAVVLATVGAAISIQSKAPFWGFVGAGAVVLLALVFRRKPTEPAAA
ncbi:Natural resistance-associated macrophage protein [Planctomycetes bacterium MalM25]|nr:Natural resistance-associated macrophage protein [Planctomycetes bacterium MalM25]